MLARFLLAVFRARVQDSLGDRLTFFNNCFRRQNVLKGVSRKQLWPARRCFARGHMQRLFRIFLAAIYATTTLTVVVSQTDAVRNELERATLPATSELDSQDDSDSAKDPHFSHAKKVGPDFDFSAVPVVWHTISSVCFMQCTFGSDYQIFQNPRPARAPPLCS